MKITHQGYQVERMIGDLSAKITDTGGFVEIILTPPPGLELLSYDIQGLEFLAKEIGQLTVLARNVEAEARRDEGQ